MPKPHRCAIRSITNTTSISETLPRFGGAVASSPPGCWTSPPRPCSRTPLSPSSRAGCRIRVKAAGPSKPPSMKPYRHQYSRPLYMSVSVREHTGSLPVKFSLQCVTNLADTRKVQQREMTMESIQQDENTGDMISTPSRDEQIRRRAYEIYLERGEQPGRE